MASIPTVLLTIIALAAIPLVIATGALVLVAAIIVVVTRKQRSREVPAVASPAPAESADNL